MELIANAAVGAAVGELMLGKRMGNRALGWGALCGLLPSVFIVLWPFLDTASRMWWHRGPGYSLLAAAVAAVVLARPLSKRWKKDKISPQLAGGFVFVAWGMQVLLACFDATGAVVLWPFSGQRVAFGHLHWGDPLVTMPLLVCVVWMAFLRKPKERAKRRRLLGWGVGLCAGYVAFTVAMKFTAAAGFEADLAERGVDHDRRVVMPEPFTALAWRAVVDRGDELWVGRRSVFQWPSTPVRWVIYPRGTGEPGGLDDEREARRFQAFADGYWIARPHNRGLWMADLRGGELREFEARDHMVDHRMAVAWNFEPEAPKDRLIAARAERPGLGATLRETGMRIIGREEGADLVPRLAGVPGQFPEILGVEE